MSLDLCGPKLLIFILFAEFECDDSYFSIQEGKCIDVSVPGDVIPIYNVSAWDWIGQFGPLLIGWWCNDAFAEFRISFILILGAIPNWFGAPVVKLLDPTERLVPAPR